MEARGKAAINKRARLIEEDQRRGFVPGSEESTHNGKGFQAASVIASLVTGKRRGYYNGQPFDASHEWEMSDEVLRSGGGAEVIRAQGTDTGVDGQFLVPGAVFMDRFIEKLRPATVALRLGMRQENYPTFPIELPTEVTSPTAGGVAEDEALAETSVSFGRNQLTPHTCGTFIKASRRFMNYGASADARIERLITREIGIKWDAWALLGLGYDDEPMGVLKAATKSVDFTGLTDEFAVYEKLLLMEEALSGANVLTDGAKWALCNKAPRAFRMIKSENAAAGTESADVARKVISEGAEKAVIGYPFLKTNQLSSGADADVCLGDWDMSEIAMFGQMVIEASNTANDALQKRQTHIVAYTDIDIGIEQTDAFCIATDYDLSSY